MNISELSIRRPVMASVLTIIILLFGFIGYSYLGVREYPSVDNPIISVTCSYPGANADVIENQITEPLEQNINGIPGIRSLSSVSSQGQSRITVEFELSVDLETAANDVRDKVSRAQRYLPRDCDPPTVTKADADATPILMVTIQSDKRSLLELSEIADLTVKEQLQTISDVSGVQIWGEKRYSMRLWLDPAKMAGYGITPADVGQLPVEVSDHQALHCKDFRVGLSGADQLFQPLGFGKGIVVEQHHIFTVRQRNALIHCMGKSGIGAVFDEGEIFAAAIAAGLLKAFVGGTVVHHNEPEVLFGLGIDRLDRILQPALAVDIRDHDSRFIHKYSCISVQVHGNSIAYLHTKRNRIPAGCGFGRAKIMRQGLSRCWKEWCRDPRRTPEPPHRWELR